MTFIYTNAKKQKLDGNANSHLTFVLWKQVWWSC